MGWRRWGLLKIWERALRKTINAFIVFLKALSQCSLSLSEIERRYAAFKQYSVIDVLEITKNVCDSLRVSAVKI